MALWSSAPPTAPPTSPRLLGTRFSPFAWELGLQEVADASNWEWQTASVVASSLIVLSTCLLLAAWAAMRCLAHLLSRVAKAADDAAAADEAALLSPSLPRSQERSGSDIECHSVPVGVCAETSSNLPTSGALTTASILLPRNVQLPAPHCTTRGLMPLAGVPAAPSLPATPTAARRSGEPARSPPSRKYLEAYCRAQSLTRPAPAAAASHNGAGAVSDGDSFGAPVFRQDQFGAPVFAPSGPNRESVFASSLGLPLVPPLLPRRLLPAPPPGAAAHYSASPQSGLSELPELSRELSRELSGESPVSPRPYSPGGTATAGYSPPTFMGRSVGVVLGMHEGEDTRKVPIAGVFLPQIEFELSRLAREAAERVAPAVRAAKEEIAKHFEDIEEAAAAEAKARVAAAAEAAAAEAAAAEAAARKAAAAAEAIAKEAVAEAGPNKAGPNKAGAEATADVAAEVAEVAEEVAAVAVTRALSRSAAAEAAAAEVAAAEKAAAEAAAHAEKEKAAAVKLAAEKAAQAQAQAQMVEAEKAAAERCAKARRASAAKAREKATAQPVAVAVPSPVRRAAARQVLLAVRKRSLAAFDEINLATLDLAIEQLQLDLATISQPQLDLATVAWSEQSSDHHGASACVPVSKESSIAKLATVGSRMEVLMSLDGS